MTWEAKEVCVCVGGQIVLGSDFITQLSCTTQLCSEKGDIYTMGVAICRAALHIGVVHSLICRAGMNQSKRLVLVT